MLDFTQFSTQIPLFLLVFTRLSALIFTDVITGAAFVPKRFRLLLALSLSFMVFPQITGPNQLAVWSLSFGMLWCAQLLIGASMALVFQILFQLVLYAGQLIASLCGLSFATLIDPNVKSHVGLLSEVYYLACVLLFLSQNGHLMVMSLLVMSFQHLDFTTDVLSSLRLDQLTQLASLLFSGGINIALPAITSLLVVNVTFGFLSRSAPQMNLFNIGLPITLMAGFVIIFLSFPILLSGLDHYFKIGFAYLSQQYGGAT